MAISAQVKGINPWHRDLADWLILNGTGPGWSGKAAEKFNVTRAWLSTVYHSDAFQNYYLTLRDEITKPQLFSAREKMMGVLDQSIERLSSKLEDQGQDIPLSGLLETIDILAKRTGHGEAKASSDAQVINQVMIVSKEDLQESRARMRGVSKPLVLDAISNEVVTTPTNQEQS